MNTRIRHLAMYVPMFDPCPAGLGVYIDQIGRRLVTAIPRITVFTQTPETVPWRGVEVVRVPSSAQPGSLDVVRRQAYLHTQLPLRLAQIDADALFVPFHDGCLLPSRPQFMVVHDLTPLVYPSPFFNPLLRRYLTNMLPRVMARTARVIAVSRNTQLDLVRLLQVDEDRTVVVTEGYDDTVFRAHAREEIVAAQERLGVEGQYVLYAGTFARHKNVGLLVDAFVALRRRVPGIRLVLCGRTDAGDFASVRTHLMRARAWEHTRVLGYVEAPDLSKLMSGAAVFAYPSLYEGFGLAPLEAMASGAVVVASTAASVPEVVGDGGVLLSPHEPDLWSDTMARLIADDRASHELRSAASARARRFDWDAASASILDVMDQYLYRTRAHAAVEGA